MKISVPVPGGQNLPGFQGEGLDSSLMNVSIGHIPLLVICSVGWELIYRYVSLYIKSILYHLTYNLRIMLFLHASKSVLSLSGSALDYV